MKHVSAASQCHNLAAYGIQPEYAKISLLTTFLSPTPKGLPLSENLEFHVHSEISAILLVAAKGGGGHWSTIGRCFIWRSTCDSDGALCKVYSI